MTLRYATVCSGIEAPTVAALYVETGGVYCDLPGVEVWDEDRDARLYGGSYAIVAHPPCARWNRYWSGGPSAKVRRIKGDDDGCFAAATPRTSASPLRRPACRWPS